MADSYWKVLDGMWGVWLQADNKTVTLFIDNDKTGSAMYALKNVNVDMETDPTHIYFHTIANEGYIAHKIDAEPRYVKQVIKMCHSKEYKDKVLPNIFWTISDNYDPIYEKEKDSYWCPKCSNEVNSTKKSGCWEWHCTQCEYISRM